MINKYWFSSKNYPLEGVKGFLTPITGKTYRYNSIFTHIFSTIGYSMLKIIGLGVLLGGLYTVYIIGCFAIAYVLHSFGLL